MKKKGFTGNTLINISINDDVTVGAASIQEYSKNKSTETEVLFAPYSSFRLDNIEKTEKFQIYLTWIPLYPAIIPNQFSVKPFLVGVAIGGFLACLFTVPLWNHK